MISCQAAARWGSGLKGLLLLFLLVTTVAARTPHHGDELRDFKRAFRMSRDRQAQLGERRTTLRALEGDSAEVAEALLKASLTLEREAEALEEERRSFLGSGRSNPKLQRREGLDDLRGLQASLRRKLMALKDSDAVELIVEAALNEGRLPFSMRLTLVKRVRDLPADLQWEPIRKALRERAAGTILVGLRAIIADERPSTEALPLLLKLLGHGSATVREQTAQALTALSHPEGVEPLIRRLAREEGRTRRRFAEALQVLTGQAISSSPAAWNQWWSDYGQQVLSGELPMGDGVVHEAQPNDSKYHGIPIDGKAILYVFDRSESMRAAIGGRFRPGEQVTAGEEQRIDRAKSELIAGLGSLSPDRTFNIVVFASGSASFAREMVDASPRNVERAQGWVEDLELEVATALYDGVDLSFVLGGRPARDEHYELEFDTMFVLTDGVPTVPRTDAPSGSRGGRGRGGGGAGGGQRRGGRLELDATDRILEAVRRWNMLDQVVINTIGLGDRFAGSFLESLAEENGGRFVSER